MDDFLNKAGDLFSAVGSGFAASSSILGLSEGVRSAGAQKAASYYRQGLYEVQAIDTLSMAQLRADQDTKIAALQAGRRLKQAEIESRNYQIQANNLLRNLSRTNAAVRARAAANGVRLEGSVTGIENTNTQVAMFDVGVSDLNALMARVLGFEDASNLMLAAQDQNRMNQYAAERQAAQMRLAGDFTVKSGGLLSDAQLFDSGLKFLKTNPFAGLSSGGIPGWAKQDMAKGYGYSTSSGE